MVQVFLRSHLGHGAEEVVELPDHLRASELHQIVGQLAGLPCPSPSCDFYLLVNNEPISGENELILNDLSTIEIFLPLYGGIDFQHREGGKTGSGGQLSEAQAALERKERLRKLALETIDITKDPYFMKNHLGTFECKLCLTLHTNEGSYLAHTQGKKHQDNLFVAPSRIERKQE
jgi:splicing factor 3A subunit 2